MLSRLVREVRIGLAIRHKNVVSLHDASTNGRSFYLVMDYVEGENLHERVVHRDVKPGNVLLDQEGRLTAGGGGGSGA